MSTRNRRKLLKRSCNSFQMLLIVIMLIVGTNQTYAKYDKSNNNINEFSLFEAARKLILEGDTESIEQIPFVRASVTLQRFHECIRKQSLIRCTKLFLLQKMELHPNQQNSGNITKDFVEQFFINVNDKQMVSFLGKEYGHISDDELNNRLKFNFKRFFKNRDIKFNFLSGLLVKIVPSDDNKLQLSLKKKKKPRSAVVSGRSSDDTEENTSSGESDTNGKHDNKHEENHKKRKEKKPHTHKMTLLQMAVPIMLMPTILMGTFLPFWLPVLKMATFMTMIMNNAAFVAALIMAARAQANAHDEAEHISYAQHSYHH